MRTILLDETLEVLVPRLCVDLQVVESDVASIKPEIASGKGSLTRTAVAVEDHLVLDLVFLRGQARSDHLLDGVDDGTRHASHGCAMCCQRNSLVSVCMKDVLVISEESTGEDKSLEFRCISRFFWLRCRVK